MTSSRDGRAPFTIEPALGRCPAQLLCPGCGSGMLRHGRVRVFNRRYERPPGNDLVVTVSYMRVDVVRGGPMDDNPSEERDGLLIDFECEDCENRSTLRLDQHEGSTYVAWDTAHDPDIRIERLADDDVSSLLEGMSWPDPG